MKKFVPIVFALLFAGCLSSAPDSPVSWNIAADTGLVVSSVTVSSPYDGSRLTVLRPDGSVAFDSFNVFAARPASLIRSSVAIKTDEPELIVRCLALDCRGEDGRMATVDLELRKEAKTLARAAASAPTDDGDFTRAFSAAFAEAAAGLKSGLRR